MQYDVLVAGAGPAGLSAAAGARAWGLQVALVERWPYLGGKARDLACKATDRCQLCRLCLVDDLLVQVLADPGLHLHLGTRLTALEGSSRGLTAYGRNGEDAVDPSRCTGCGDCLELCPHGAVAPPSPGHRPRVYQLDRRRCPDRCSAACAVSCPAGAVDFSRPGTDRRWEARAAIVATGFRPFTADVRPALAQAGDPHVITAWKLEQKVRHGPPAAWDGRRIAFVQCVGSRSAGGGAEYCSRHCCLTALRWARWLTRAGAVVTVHYIDLQLVGNEGVELARAAVDEGVRLVRGVPAETILAGDGVLLRWEKPEGGLDIALYDLVVLSVGQGADPGAAVTVPPGLPVWVVGTRSAPMNIGDCIMDGLAAAARAADYLERQAKGA